MAENNKTLQSSTGYYGLKDTGIEPATDQQELIDSVFSRLEKMQKRITGEKIASLEQQLTLLEHELTIFLQTGV